MYKFLAMRLLKEYTLKSYYINNKLYKIELMSDNREVIRVFDSWKECYKHLKLRKWIFENNFI